MRAGGGGKASALVAGTRSGACRWIGARNAAKTSSETEQARVSKRLSTPNRGRNEGDTMTAECKYGGCLVAPDGEARGVERGRS